MKIGTILLVIGVVFLLRAFGFFIGMTWDIIWPSLLIILGIWMIVKHECHMCCHDHNHDHGHGAHTSTDSTK